VLVDSVRIRLKRGGPHSLELVSSPEVHTDIFTLFRDLDVLRGTRRGSREIKVVGVVHYAFGLNLRKTLRPYRVLSEPFSQSSALEGLGEEGWGETQLRGGAKRTPRDRYGRECGEV